MRGLTKQHALDLVHKSRRRKHAVHQRIQRTLRVLSFRLRDQYTIGEGESRWESFLTWVHKQKVEHVEWDFKKWEYDPLGVNLLQSLCI